jgi:hypothetical protein
MVDWPENDLIRWVETRVRSFEVDRENVARGFGAEGPDHPLTEVDLRIWLKKVRDGLSFSAIAKEHFGKQWKRTKGKRGNQTSISSVRRSVARVENFLNRGQNDFRYPPKMSKQMDAAMAQWFGRLQ